MAEILQCVPAVGAKLAVKKHVREVKLEAEEKVIGHFTLKKYSGFIFQSCHHFVSLTCYEVSKVPAIVMVYGLEILDKLFHNGLHHHAVLALGL